MSSDRCCTDRRRRAARAEPSRSSRRQVGLRRSPTCRGASPATPTCKIPGTRLAARSTSLPGRHILGLLDELLAGMLSQGGLQGAQQAQPDSRQTGQAPITQGQLAGLAQAAIAMLNDPRVGGIQGLAQRLQQAGLGDVVNSWIGTGQNRPIGPRQLEEALPGEVTDISQQAGVPPQQGGSLLAQLLPRLINHLTPNGQVPAGPEASCEACSATSLAFTAAPLSHIPGLAGSRPGTRSTASLGAHRAGGVARAGRSPQGRHGEARLVRPSRDASRAREGDGRRRHHPRRPARRRRLLAVDDRQRACRPARAGRAAECSAGVAPRAREFREGLVQP